MCKKRENTFASCQTDVFASPSIQVDHQQDPRCEGHCFDSRVTRIPEVSPARDKTVSAESSTVSTVKIASRQRLSVGVVCRLEHQRCRKRRSYWSHSMPDERGQGTDDVPQRRPGGERRETARGRTERGRRRNRRPGERERRERERQRVAQEGRGRKREEEVGEKEKRRETRVRVSNVWRPERH